MNSSPILIKCNSDKSASIRMVLFCGIASEHNTWGQKLTITNLDMSEDVKAAKNFLDALKLSNTYYDDHGEKTLEIHIDKPKKEHGVWIDCLNSGTTFRLLCGILPGMNIVGFLNGDASLMARPFDRVLNPLTEMGCRFKVEEDRLAIFDTKWRLKNLEYTDEIGSAQVNSALMLFGKLRNKKVVINSNFNYRKTTEIMLDEMFETNTFRLKQTEFDMAKYQDPSSAIFFMLRSLMTQKNVTFENITWDKNRITYFDFFANNITFDGDKVMFNPNAKMTFAKMEEYSGIIDELPTLFPALALFGDQETYEFKNISELKVKESNRLVKVIEILNNLSANPNYDEANDTLSFTKGIYDWNVDFDSNHDHRLSMIAQVLNWNTTDFSNISFPGFKQELNKFN